MIFEFSVLKAKDKRLTRKMYTGVCQKVIILHFGTGTAP